jgi:hypothetical protein
MQQTIHFTWRSDRPNMRNDPALLRIERNLWLGATTMAIGILLLMILQTWSERRDRATPRRDEPAAAARSDLARRQPTDGRLDMPESYEGCDPVDRRRLHMDQRSDSIQAGSDGRVTIR